MALSMHAASVPVFVRNLNNLLGFLDKAQAHADARPMPACGGSFAL